SRSRRSPRPRTGAEALPRRVGRAARRAHAPRRSPPSTPSGLRPSADSAWSARRRRRDPRGWQPRRRPARAARSGRRRSSQDSPPLELLHGLEERAGADRVEERRPDIGEPRGWRLPVAPAERGPVEREGGRPLAQRLLLVAEDRSREEIEEAVL